MGTNIFNSIFKNLAPNPPTPPPKSQEKTEGFKKETKEDLITLPMSKNKMMSKRILALATQIYSALLQQNSREFNIDSLIKQFKTSKVDDDTLRVLILIIKGTIIMIRRIVWNTLYLCLRVLPKKEFDALDEEGIIKQVNKYFNISSDTWIKTLKRIMSKHAGRNTQYIKHLSARINIIELKNALLNFDYSTKGLSIKHESIRYKIIIRELFNFSEFSSKVEIMKMAGVSSGIIDAVGHHIHLISKKEGEHFSIYERFVELDMKKSIENREQKMIYGFPKKVRRHICRFLYGYLHDHDLLKEYLSINSEPVEELGSLLTQLFKDGNSKDQGFREELSRWLTPLFRTFTIHGEKRTLPLIIWALKDALGGLNSKEKELIRDFFKILVLMVHMVVSGFRRNEVDVVKFEELAQTRSFSGFMDDFIGDVSYIITRKFSLRPEVEDSRVSFQILEQLSPNKVLKVKQFAVDVSDGTLRRKLNNLVKQGILVKGKQGRSNTYGFVDKYTLTSGNSPEQIKGEILACLEEGKEKLTYSKKAHIRCRKLVDRVLNSKFRSDGRLFNAFHANAAAASFIHLFIQQGKLKNRALKSIGEVFEIHPIFLKFYFHKHFLPKFPEVRINKVRKQLLKARDLSNKFITVYADKLNDERYREKFKATNFQEYRPELYDSGGDDFNAIATQFNEEVKPAVDIKERTRQCALQYPFFALRNHLIDRGNLESLSEGILALLKQQQQGEVKYNYLKRFIRKGRFTYGQLKQLYPALRRDIFGERQNLSTFEINNMVGQLRNILLSESHQKLEGSLAREFGRIGTDTQLKKAFMKEVLGAIDKPQEDLLDYYFSLFIRKFKWDTTRYAKSKGYANSLFIRDFVDGWSKGNINGTIADFKEYRKRELPEILSRCPQFELDGNKPLLKKLSSEVYKKELERLAMEALEEVLLALKDVQKAPNGSLLKYICKPAFHPNSIYCLDYSGYCEYVKTKFKHQIKSLLPRLFGGIDLLGVVISNLKIIKHSFIDRFYPDLHLTLPKIKSLSLPLLQHETYDADYSTLRFSLQLQAHESEPFRIRDSRNIIQRKGEDRFQVLTSGALALNPTITLRGRILMLNQPFQILKKVGSIRSRRSWSKNRSGQSRVLGIDLGLVHWATITVMDTIEKTELENYFLDSRRIFDCRYDRYLKKNVVHERFFSPTDKNMRAKNSNFVKGVRLSSKVDVNKVYKNLKNINHQLELDKQTQEAYFKRVLTQTGLEALGPETFEQLYAAFLGGPTPEFRALLEKFAPKKHHAYILHVLETLKNHQLEVPMRLRSSEKDINTAFNKIIRELLDSPLPKTYVQLSKKDPDKFAHLIAGGILSYLSAIRFFRRKIIFNEDTLIGNIEEIERDIECERARPLGFKTIADLLKGTSAAEVRKFFTLTFQKSYLRPMNITRKLMVLRSELRSIRREINIFENNYKGKLYKSRKYYHLKQNERYLSEKVSNIHEDIVHNVARRIIDISRSWGNIPILFENLKWSQHSSKRDVGIYLAHHQTHWFFSQIIGSTIDLARRYEIPVKLVNARNTSKKCWKCGNYGARGGKEFTCNEHGGYRVDADLNAARNIALEIEA